MTEFFGNFDESTASEEYLVLGFSPSSIPLKQRWRNNGLSADFLADYLTTFFPVNETDTNAVNKQVEVKGAVSYIANELLENAMKFNDCESGFPVNIQLQLLSDCIIFRVTNSVPIEIVPKFQNFIQQLLDSDPQELYIQQLEKIDDHNTSRVGLLTMMNDYMAELGWKFETVQQDPPVTKVTTMVKLAI
ncbi:MAG: ATP-binding protein [Beggiatoa sp. IS2]|nr:MAG: ATP-binding protein [Beggiatoa sp. IS2]